ncbi:phenoloxidase-activating factor 2 [Drosophila busckii]|uniref:phenoloxidase-activating factor 2 n=1 Tax=Drosophila busckii TaxID=30019 RepID=UPI00083F2E6E|nr:phenoloxidase-activating factor 2 [Drosophila busckii]
MAVKPKHILLLQLLVSCNYLLCSGEHVSLDFVLSVSDIIENISESPVENNVEEIFDVSTKPTIVKPRPAVSENSACGADKECVQKYLCKDQPVNEEGQIEISYRSLDEPCTYLEVCCAKNKTTETKDTVYVIPKNECGKRSEKGVTYRLMNAVNREAQYGEIPWMIALFDVSSGSHVYIGGGSLVAPDMILTAGHKVLNKAPNRLVARAGEWDTHTNKEPHPHYDRHVKSITLHPQFDIRFGVNNIALLQLTLPFSASPQIAPICLPSADNGEQLDLDACIVTGWGATSFNSTAYHNVLKKITLGLVPNAQCEATYRRLVGSKFSPHASILCAGGKQGEDTCTGDGGSPLVCPLKSSPDRYFQVGIVSAGIGCYTVYPGLYTNVMALMPWLRQQLNARSISSEYYTYV